MVCAKVATSGSVLTASQASRLDFTKPCDKYEEGGYQICNGYIAINDGGLLPYIISYCISLLYCLIFL